MFSAGTGSLRLLGENNEILRLELEALCDLDCSFVEKAMALYQLVQTAIEFAVTISRDPLLAKKLRSLLMKAFDFSLASISIITTHRSSREVMTSLDQSLFDLATRLIAVRNFSRTSSMGGASSSLFRLIVQPNEIS